MITSNDMNINKLNAKSISFFNNLTSRLSNLTKQLEDIDNDNSLTEEQKQQKKAELQKEIEDVNKQIDVEKVQEKNRKKKLESKKKAEKIKEEINKAGNAKAKKLKA